MRVAPFKYADWWQVDGREEIAGGEYTWLLNLQATSPAWTLWDGDIAIASAGVVIFNGIGSVWMRVCDNPPNWLFRHCKRMMMQAIKDNGIRRLETVIAESKLTNQRFISRLGFQIESRAKNYFPDEDGIRWEFVA